MNVADELKLGKIIPMPTPDRIAVGSQRRKKLGSDSKVTRRINPDAAPSGPAFALTQGVVLMFYLVTGFLAVRRFRPSALAV